MKKHFYLLFILSVFAYSGIYAQDTLYLMSGRMKTNITVLDMDSNKIAYYPGKDVKVKNNGLVKTKYKESSNVFEIRYEDGTRELIYKTDSVRYIITPDEARSYVDGCHDAFLYSHNRIIGPACFAVTFGSFFIINLNALLVTVPCIFSAATAMFTPEFPFDKVDSSKVNKHYMLGYQDTRKIKNVKSSMFFGIAALATGFILKYTRK